MGGNGLEHDGALIAPVPAACSIASDRFAGWDRRPARLGLFALLFLVVMSALVPINDPTGAATSVRQVATQADGKRAPEPYRGAYERDQDLALYRAVTRRVAAGEGYYDVVVEEQRARNYPVNPGIAVRLPTLAWLSALLGKTGQIAAAMALMAGAVMVWWRRFGDEPGIGSARRMATAMVAVGASLAVNRHYFPLHELWSGMLLALAFGLHRIGGQGRGGRWHGAWCAAALALFLRELALPFVLLMGATALWYGNRREALAWGALVALFAAVMALHLQLVSARILPTDRPSDPWLALRGLSGWLGNYAGASNLRLLPHWLAGPGVILTALGWAGWKTRAGAFGFLLATGYGLAFMIAGRWNNFYWGAMIAPATFAGLALAPRALVSLVRAAMAPAGSSPKQLRTAAA